MNVISSYSIEVLDSSGTWRERNERGDKISATFEAASLARIHGFDRVRIRPIEPRQPSPELVQNAARLEQVRQQSQTARAEYQRRWRATRKAKAQARGET